jgi:hypothetical protein
MEHRARRASTANKTAVGDASRKANAENIEAENQARSQSAPKRGRPKGVVDPEPRKRRGHAGQYRFSQGFQLGWFERRALDDVQLSTLVDMFDKQPDAAFAQVCELVRTRREATDKQSRKRSSNELLARNSKWSKAILKERHQDINTLTAGGMLGQVMYAALENRGEPTAFFKKLLIECKDIVDGLSNHVIRDLDVLFSVPATKVEALQLKIDLGLSDRKYQLLANYLSPGVLPNLRPVKETGWSRCPEVKILPKLNDAAMLASWPSQTEHDLALLVQQMGIDK